MLNNLCYFRNSSTHWVEFNYTDVNFEQDGQLNNERNIIEKIMPHHMQRIACVYKPTIKNNTLN